MGCCLRCEVILAARTHVFTAVADHSLTRVLEGLHSYSQTESEAPEPQLMIFLVSTDV